jgi:hypothetical protein
MRLPHAERAYVDPRKVSNYLLSATHPVGRHKARYFWSLGFNPDDLERLTAALLRAGEKAASFVKSFRRLVFSILWRAPSQRPTGPRLF